MVVPQPEGPTIAVRVPGRRSRSRPALGGVIVAVLQLFDCAQNIDVGLLPGLDDTKSGFPHHPAGP